MKIANKYIYPLLLITYLTSLSAGNLVQEKYKHLNNNDFLSEVTKDMQQLIIKNNGAMELSRYEKTISISKINFPATLKYIIEMDFELYKKDQIEMAVNNSKNNNLKKIKEFYESDKVRKMAQKGMSESIVTQLCSKEDYRYILNRNIDILWTYREKSGKFFTEAHITKKDCEN